MTIKDTIIALFGNYIPVGYTVGNDTIIPSGASGLDWEWLVGVLLFALSFYCIMRILGVIIQNVIRR